MASWAVRVTPVRGVGDGTSGPDDTGAEGVTSGG
jgi:hypothetical protein